MYKRFHFCACAGECPLKDAEPTLQKNPVITLVSKALIICIKSNLGGDI